MAGTRHPDAAELDREVAGRESKVCGGGRGGGRANRSLYHAHRHDLWRDGSDPGPRTSASGETAGEFAGARGSSCQADKDAPDIGENRGSGDHGERRFLHGALRRQSLQRREVESSKLKVEGEKEKPKAVRSDEAAVEEAFTEYGVSVNSGPYSGMESETAIAKMAAFAEEKGFGRAETIFRLKDWGISRQRYWGTPIPVVYCSKDGMVPVPDKDLPV